MRDHYRGFAAPFEFRENPVVEDLLKHGVLIRSPFVKDINRTVFQVGSQKRKTFTLSLRQLGRRKFSILDAYLVIQFQGPQIFLPMTFQLTAIYTVEMVKQIEVGKDH